MPLAGSHTNLAASWVSIHDGSSASLITWTINGHSTSGNITGSSLDQTGLSIDSKTYAFTGTISGSSVTLNLSGGSTLTGSVSTIRLQLQIADSAGTVQSYNFTPGTVSAYNAAVKSIQSVVSKNQTSSTQESSINSAAQTVSNDVSSIDSDVSNWKGSVPGLESDLTGMAGDVQTTKNSAAVTQNVNPSESEACDDAYTTQDDAYTVQDDMYSLQDDEGSANTYLTSLNSTLSSLPSDWSTYQQALTAMPNYQSQYAVSSSQEHSALSQGASESSVFSAKESQITATGQSLLNEANQVAASALTDASNRTSGGC